MCICVNIDPVACKAERYGYSVQEYHGAPCECVCHKKAICTECGGLGSFVDGYGNPVERCLRCNPKPKRKQTSYDSTRPAKLEPSARFRELIEEARSQGA